MGVGMDFFKSGRGLRQGDPLSPSLFVLNAELLSLLLNELQKHRGYRGFYMSSYGPQINHLAFADDFILFCNGGKTTLQLIQATLATYEQVSGQKINKSKCSFSVPSSATQRSIRRIEEITEMRHEPLPINYLGCPIYSGRKKLSTFAGMVSRVINKIKGWHLKLLSSEGRAVLIRHVLLVLNVHTLAAVHPTKGTIATIERYLASFFWSGQETSDRYHWSAWSKLCFPYEGGGASFRKLEDVCKAFTAKQWWRLRTTNSLWSQFVKAKYCKIYHPLISQWTAGKSNNWQAMCKLKYEVEQNILWRVGRGNSSFWYDNWTNFGPLSSSLSEDVGYDNTKVNEVYRDGVWD